MLVERCRGASAKFARMSFRPRNFASDNVSAICPEAWATLTEANRDHMPGYGDDAWTARATSAIRERAGRPCDVLFVFTGTAANALALAALCPPYGRVACHTAAHVAQDECGAPSFLGGGLQLALLDGPNGKLTPESLERWASTSDLHVGKPSAVTLTQSTELGTVYSLDELRAVREVARRRGLRIHLDGARIANAMASLGCGLGELVEAAGCDVLSLGGTKNGIVGSEALVVFDRALTEALDFRRKQAGQLASKSRFLSAPWVGLLESGAFERNAQNANALAARLEAGLRELGLPAVNPREANAVFVKVPPDAAKRLQEAGWRFYFEACWGGDRFVCGWDTRPDDVDALLHDVREALG